MYSNAYKSAVGDKTKVAQEARKAYPIWIIYFSFLAHDHTYIFNMMYEPSQS